MVSTLLVGHGVAWVLMALGAGGGGVWVEGVRLGHCWRIRCRWSRRRSEHTGVLGIRGGDKRKVRPGRTMQGQT